jgi:hypothetical protein
MTGAADTNRGGKMLRISATAVAGLVALALAASADATARSPRAVAAHSLNAEDNCNAHFVRASGSNLVEEGPCSGPLGGTVRGTLHVAATFTGSFTFYTRYGQIRGRGTAHPHPSRNGVESFSGSLTISGGTGRFAHAHGSAGFYGTFNRKNYAIFAQTRGTLYY